MQLPDDTLDDVRKRLRRAEGQIRGVLRMLDEGAECREILTQLSAVTRALEKAGLRLVASGMTYCLQNPEQAGEEGYGVDEVERMLMRLR